MYHVYITHTIQLSKSDILSVIDFNISSLHTSQLNGLNKCVENCTIHLIETVPVFLAFSHTILCIKESLPVIKEIPRYLPVSTHLNCVP